MFEKYQDYSITLYPKNTENTLDKSPICMPIFVEYPS